MEIRDFESNLKKAERLILKSFNEFKPDFICLPEYFSVTSLEEPIEEIYERTFYPTISLLEEISEKLGIYIVGGTVIEKEKDKYYNTAFLFKNGEILGKYKKIHITDKEREKGLEAGKDFFVYDSGHARIGILICADILYPETVKKLAVMGADVIFLPISLPSEDHPPVTGHPASVKMARENSLFILKNACLGLSSRGKIIGSKSAIVSPWGIVREAEKENKEEIVSAELDLYKFRKR